MHTHVAIPAEIFLPRTCANSRRIVTRRSADSRSLDGRLGAPQPSSDSRDHDMTRLLARDRDWSGGISGRCVDSACRLEIAHFREQLRPAYAIVRLARTGSACVTESRRGKNQTEIGARSQGTVVVGVRNESLAGRCRWSTVRGHRPRVCGVAGEFVPSVWRMHRAPRFFPPFAAHLYGEDVLRDADHGQPVYLRGFGPVSSLPLTLLCILCFNTTQHLFSNVFENAADVQWENLSLRSYSKTDYPIGTKKYALWSSTRTLESEITWTLLS